jgi:hypothetical protein
MTNVVLNIGAGFLPLVASDFDDLARLINFDILHAQTKQDVSDRLRFLILIRELKRYRVLYSDR